LGDRFDGLGAEGGCLSWSRLGLFHECFAFLEEGVEGVFGKLEGASGKALFLGEFLIEGLELGGELLVPGFCILGFFVFGLGSFGRELGAYGDGYTICLGNCRVDDWWLGVVGCPCGVGGVNWVRADFQ
jgi:hypothetical protein